MQLLLRLRLRLLCCCSCCCPLLPLRFLLLLLLASMHGTPAGRTGADGMVELWCHVLRKAMVAPFGQAPERRSGLSSAATRRVISSRAQRQM